MALTDTILVSYPAASFFVNPNLMQGRGLINDIVGLIKFVLSMKFKIVLNKYIANRLTDTLIYTCVIRCFK